MGKKMSIDINLGTEKEKKKRKDCNLRKEDDGIDYM